MVGVSVSVRVCVWGGGGGEERVCVFGKKYGNVRACEWCWRRRLE